MFFAVDEQILTQRVGDGHNCNEKVVLSVSGM